jgi:predicted RNA-binding protein with PUA domain
MSKSGMIWANAPPISRAKRAALRKAPKRYEWYCDQCHVIVRSLRCQHCGKSEQEPT